MTDLFDTLEPTPIVLQIGTKEFPVKNLTVAEVYKLDSFAQLGDVDGAAFAASMFDGDVPLAITTLQNSIKAGDTESWSDRHRKLQAVTLIVSAVAIAYAQQFSGKKMTDAINKIGECLRETGESEA